MELVLRGKCWKFGDNIGNEDILSTNFIRHKADDSAVYAEYLMHDFDPHFARKVRKGDIIVAGKRFSHGNMHWHAFEAIKFYGMGLITESMPRGAFRNAVSSGLPLIPFCTGITQKVEQGDELEVNFRTGEIKNITKRTATQGDPLPGFLLEIMEAGGSLANLKRRFGQ